MATRRETESSWRRFAPAAVILAVGFALSVTAFVTVRNLENAELEDDFQQRAGRIAATLKGSVEFSLDDAYSLADFFAVSRHVDAMQFRLFAKPMLERHSALLSLIWVQRVPGSARAAYEAEVRATRRRGLEIFERDGRGQLVRAASRPEYFVIHYRESVVEPNAQKVLGFDVASKAASRDGMARARDTGVLTASGRVATLVSDGKEFGFLAIVPVYRKGLHLSTLEARQANLLGFAQAVFSVRHLVDTALPGTHRQGINMLIFDRSADQSERVLYRYGSDTASKTGKLVEDEPTIRSGLHFSTVMPVGGREWELLFYPTSAYLSTEQSAWSLGVLGGGLLVTAALVAYLLSAARANRIERLVARRTSELSSANEALQREIIENRFQRAAFEAAADGMIITDETGKIKWVNPAFCRLTGWAASEAIGQTPTILKSGEHSADFYRAMWATLLSGSTWRGEMVNRRKDGTRYTEQQTITPVAAEDGRITGFVAVKHDVTEKRRLAATLRQQEAHYRSLIENIQDMVFVVDADGINRYASPSVERALGYAPRERVGSPALELVHPDDVPRVARLFAPGSRDNGLIGPAEYRVRHRDGSWRRVEAVGKNLSTGQAHQGVVVTVRDITERHQAEELQQKLKAQLSQREKLAALGELLAGVAHELNNPLSVVIGHATLLERVNDPNVKARGVKLKDAATRCARIVKNFLSLARQHAPEHDRVDVNAIVREVVELLAYQLRVDDAAVTLDLSDDLPLLWADPHQLRQVLVNLITNAHHAVRESSMPRRISIASRFDPEKFMLRLEVSDSGPGIAPEVESRIFEPFFTTKPRGQGTGLGLPICKGIIESHGGMLEVEGRPGVGALFRAWLPPGEEPRSLREDEAQAPRTGHGETVLVVDDEPDVAELLAEMLSGAGYRVDTAENGRVAVRKITEKAYDVVLSDLKMPVLDGPGLYQEIKMRRPELLRRFAFITGDTLSPTAAQFLETTRATYLKKPFAAEDAERVVDRVLAGSGRENMD